MMKLPTLPEVRKALGALGVMEVAAVGYGLIDSATAGLIAAGLGVLTSGVVYLLDNEKPAVKPEPVTAVAAAPVEPPVVPPVPPTPAA